VCPSIAAVVLQLPPAAPEQPAPLMRITTLGHIPVEGTVAWDAGTGLARFFPSAILDPSTRHTVFVKVRGRRVPSLQPRGGPVLTFPACGPCSCPTAVVASGPSPLRLWRPLGW
jgi:hypothetical protein